QIDEVLGRCQRRQKNMKPSTARLDHKRGPDDVYAFVGLAWWRFFRAGLRNWQRFGGSHRIGGPNFLPLGLRLGGQPVERQTIARSRIAGDEEQMRSAQRPQTALPF